VSDKKVPKMLQALPAPRMEEVRDELIRGISPAALSKSIQKDWGLMTKIKTTSLTRCLRRYRESHISEIELLEHMGLQQTANAAVARLDEHINAMEGYQELIQIQMRRVRMANDLEIEGNTLYKQTGFDIDVANRLLTGYVNTAVKAGVINQMVPEPETAPSVITNPAATLVLQRVQLKEGLMAVIGNILQDVQDLTDDIHAAP
jgi:hypothetical protein